MSEASRGTLQGVDAGEVHGDGVRGAGVHGGAPLVLRGVSRSYRSGDTDLHVLRGADLVLRAGEIVALVAPSGTGKSTLLHLAGLLERPDAGSVVVDGRDAGGLPDNEQRGVRGADAYRARSGCGGVDRHAQPGVGRAHGPPRDVARRAGRRDRRAQRRGGGGDGVVRRAAEGGRLTDSTPAPHIRHRRVAVPRSRAAGRQVAGAATSGE